MEKLIARIKALNEPLNPQETDVVAELNPLHGARAVLFDVYGTLIISGSGDVGTAVASSPAEAFRQSLEHWSGVPVGDKTAGTANRLFFETIRRFHEQERQNGAESPEVEIRDVWREVLGGLSGEPDFVHTASSKKEIEELAVEYECRVNPVWPMPGAEELIAKLREQGMVTGIVSNAQFYTPLLFSAFFGTAPEGLGFDPDLCVWSYELRRGKPDPAMFETAARRLREKHGIEPSEAVYVGNDMLNDVYAAQVAGFRTVLFAGDRRSLRQRPADPRCRNLRPDAVITSLNQLSDLLTNESVS